MISSAAPPSSATEALGMLKAAMGYLATADATAMRRRHPGPRACRLLEQAHLDGHRSPHVDPGRVHLRPGLLALTRTTARGRG